jgi:uncharacterized membrane protein
MQPVKSQRIVVISAAAVAAALGSIRWTPQMPTFFPPSRDADVIEAHVTIRRPVGDVFSFYRDFGNLPRFLGDVMAIESLGHATYRWTIQGPLGVRGQWTVRVTEEVVNTRIRYETLSSPRLRTYWAIDFAPGPDSGQTEVRETMRAPLGRVGRAALALIGKFPSAEVTANLHRLKEVMETGTVSDTRNAIRGKFDRPVRTHRQR